MDAVDAVWLGAGIEPSRMICLVSLTILVYDYLSTLDQEINLIWKRRLGSIATVLFLVNRYLPYVYVLSIQQEYWFFARTQKVCQLWDIANAVPVAIGLTVSELILALRTWAIWKRSRTILAILGIAACIKVPLVLLALYHVLKDVHYINISSSEIICMSPVIGPWSWETLTFTVILMVESLIAILTLIKAVEARHSQSRWYFKMHYMGIIYYLYNLAMSICNLIGTVYLHNMGAFTFALLQSVLQSVLCSRVIFLARQPSDLGIGTAIETNQTYLLSSHHSRPELNGVRNCGHNSSN